jgi:hypothetical protein
VEFSYKLTGTGWGEARIADEEAHVVLPTSYLSDVLGDLLQALGILLEGSPTAECSWEEEPGEYRWVFNSSDDDVALRILAFRNSWPRRPEEEGEVVFATVGPLRDIADAIVTGAPLSWMSTAKTSTSADGSSTRSRPKCSRWCADSWARRCRSRTHWSGRNSRRARR